MGFNSVGTNINTNRRNIIMKAQERKYLLQRIDEIAKKKKEAINRKRIEAYNNKLYEILKKGTFKVKKPEHGRWCTSVNALLDIKLTKREPSYYDEVQEVDDKVRDIKDEIFLGDSENALKMLKDFESFKV
jgi:hypothetical protein